MRSSRAFGDPGKLLIAAGLDSQSKVFIRPSSHWPQIAAAIWKFGLQQTALAHTHTHRGLVTYIFIITHLSVPLAALILTGSGPFCLN